jgi:hypothetical protein
MSTTPPAVGFIRLLDAAIPALDAGLYRLTSSLDVQQRDPGGTLSPLASPSPQTMHFEVSGPRFTIDRGDVSDRQPPPDAKGAFGDRLPHIALGRRTLAWERLAPDGMPWLALLLFRSDEAQLATGTLSALLPPPVIATLQGLDPFTGDPSVTVVRVKDLATFRAVLPSRKDVTLLAHVRQVNMSDTALAGPDDDGIFAVVVANRLPLSSSVDGTTYLACLVSLEGRDDAWTVTTGQAPALIVLHSWTFTSSGAGGTFEHLAATVDAAPFGATAGGSPSLLSADGTIAVQGTDRDGNSGTARYRGPLLGLATGQPLGAASNDISSASAFELGRLLGGADGRFLRELAGWHGGPCEADRADRTGVARAGSHVDRGRTPRDHDSDGEERARALARGARREAGKHVARASRGRERPRRRTETEIANQKETTTMSRSRSTGAMLVARRIDSLRSAVTAARASALRARDASRAGAAGASTEPELPPYVSFTLARWRLLSDVPFRYVVPDARLLPEESIRFFTLDTEWLDALTSGAVATGGVGTRELAQARMAIGRSVAAAERHQPFVRDVMRGRLTVSDIAPAARNGATATGIVSGFLLRSGLVTGWPAMQVRAWASDDPVDVPRDVDSAALATSRPDLVVPILRLERLSPAVLIALFDGVPRLVWLEEPHHGVQYGVEAVGTGFQVTVPDQSGHDTSVAVPMRAGPVTGVVDVNGLAAAINQLRSASAPRGPAALALDLIESPFRQRFDARTAGA